MTSLPNPRSKGSKPLSIDWLRSNCRVLNGCWEWLGSTDGLGRYGKIRCDGRIIQTHRLSYELTHGATCAGLVIDHLCKNTICCNPDHLEAVTSKTNSRRGRAFKRVNGACHRCNSRDFAIFGSCPYERCRRCMLEYRARKDAA